MPFIYNTDKFDSCLNTYRDKMGFKLGIGSTDINQQYEASTMMPLDFSLEMDGISGIIPNSAFEIPADTFPNSYLTKKGKPKVAFILHSIEHNFNSNKWTTKITGQTLNIRFDPLSPEEIKAREEAIKELQLQQTDTYSNNPITNFIAGGSEAKIAAEFYLGRKMTDTEWVELVSATFAESSPNQTEQAYVMAVILNRSRKQNKTITQILNASGQFQAVTGDKKNGFKSSSNYVKGPSDRAETSIYGAAKNILFNVPRDILFFTSNNPAIYSQKKLPYLYEQRKSGFIIGGSVFSKTSA